MLTEVKWRQRVSGPIAVSGPVQVLIHSRDSRWYLQAPAQVTGLVWEAPCVFGSEDAPVGAEYEIALVPGQNTVKVPRLDTLPDETLPGTVRVQRAAESPQAP